MPMSAFLIVYILTNQVSTAFSGFVENPNVTKTGFIGESIHLNWKLSVTDVADFIKWTLDATTIASTQKINATYYYNIISDPFKGRVTISEKGSLTINSLEITDEGKITCVVTLDTGTVVTNDTDLFVLVTPTFVTTPVASQQKIEGESTTLNCAFDSKPQAQLAWFKDNIEVSSNDLVGIETTNTSQSHSVTRIESRLQISNISRTDSGLYKCVAIYEHGNEERSSDLTVYYPVTIVTFPSHQSETVEGATNFEIICDVESNPQPNITWYRDSVPVTSSDAQYTISSAIIIKKETYRTIFTIKVVNKDDFANYTCKAVNNIPGRGKQVTQQTTTLVVTHKPYFLSKPKNVLNIVKGDDVILNCTVQAFPEPTVNWTTNAPVNSRFKFHPPKLLQKTQGKRVVEALLEIQSVSKEDYGIYSCVTSDGTNVEITNTTLFIHYEPIILNSFPAHQTIAEASISQLRCNVESYPQAEIDWIYSKHGMSTKINVTHRSSLVVMPSNTYEKKIESILTFQNGGISREEEGIYQCIAKNVLGSKNMTTNITVQWPSEFSTDSINGGKVVVKQGEGVSLKCIVSSKPIAEIKWLKNDLHEMKASVESVLFENSTTKIKESFLTFTDIQPDSIGWYSCVAVNEVANSTERRIRKKYIDVLYPPIVKAVNSTREVNITEGLTLSCEAQANPPVSHYLWKKNDVILSFNQSALYFLNVNEGDEGTYTCTPTNSEGVGATVWHTITIKVTPTITRLPTCDQIERVLFCICDGVGYPSPIVEWTKEGSSQLLSNKTTLNFTITDDTPGKYVCTLKNVHGESYSSVIAGPFVPPVEEWSQWSDCNTTCGLPGYENRTRVCNFNPCTEDLIDRKTCVVPCPIAGSVSESWHKDWYILFWVLIPIVLVLFIILILWMARRKTNKKSAVFVPVNRSLSQPPSIRSITTTRDIFLPETRAISAVNKGYIKDLEMGNDDDGEEEHKRPVETDTIEVEMQFGAEDDLYEGVTDTLQSNALQPDYDQGEDVVNAAVEHSRTPSLNEDDGGTHSQELHPRLGGDGNSASESYNENDDFTFNNHQPHHEEGFLKLYDYASPMKPPRNNKSTFGAPINQMGNDNEAFYSLHQNGFV